MLKRIALPGLFIAALLLAAACRRESRCHMAQAFVAQAADSDMADSSTGLLSTFIDGRTRVFVWSKVIEKICPAEPVSVTTGIQLTGWQPDSAMQVFSYVSWNYTRKQDINLQKSEDNKLSGETEVDLLPDFEDKSGWFVPGLMIKFPSHGSYAADTAYLNKRVHSIALEAKYFD